MKNFIVLFLTLLVLGTELFAQDHSLLPTQKDIVKNGALRYFKRLPVEGWNRLLYLANLGSYQLILNQHQNNPEKSPFRIFNFMQHRRTLNSEWEMAIKNTAVTDYSDVLSKSEFGVCAGLTIVTRKLQMLAHFDPKNLENQDIPSKSQNPKEWFEFMKQKIDDIITYNKMSIIPEFKNIKELSLEPLLQKYLKENVVRQWELTNINFLQGVFQGYAGSVKKQNLENISQSIKKIKKTLALNINPLVFLSKFNQKLFSTDRWIHVVQVASVIENQDKSFELIVWDPNDSAVNSSSIRITAKGEITFGYNEIAGIIPLKWDDFEISDMIVKNLKFCSDRPGFCTKLTK